MDEMDVLAVKIVSEKWNKHCKYSVSCAESKQTKKWWKLAEWRLITRNHNEMRHVKEMKTAIIKSLLKFSRLRPT